jgi:hypothetical protein
MKFYYSKVLLPVKSEILGSSILKPIIPVKIIVGDKVIRYSALVDSGADFCIFDAEIGENLGLDIKSGKRELFGGIQARGGAEAYFHEVKLNVGGWEYKTIVGFSYDIAKHGFGVLGQKGFFDIFMVKFDLLKGEIELKERK